MKKIIPIIFATIICIIGVFLIFQKVHSPQLQISNESLPISATITTQTGQKIKVRVADTPQTRELGLSYFKSLPADQGMLFLFDQPGNYPFWMKGMNFPIDIIWLKKVSEGSFEVVYIAENVDPSTYPQSVDPKREADAVLEIGMGRAKEFGITEGVFLKQ